MRSRLFSIFLALVLSFLTSATPAFPQSNRPGIRQLPYTRPTAFRHHAMPRSHATPAASSTAPGFVGFYAAPYYTVGDNTGNDVSEDATITADFNKDGKPDIASVSFDGVITLLLNDGKGSFLKPVASSGGLSSIPDTIPLAFASDFNGDGYPDIAMGPAIPNGGGETALIAVSLNQKDGTFGPLIFLSIPSSAVGTYNTFAIATNPTSKRQDLVGVTGVGATNSFQVFLTRFANNGTGSFTAQTTQTVTLPAAASPNEPAFLSMSFADVNQDGIPDFILRRDLYVVGDGTYIDVLLGNSNGTFQQPKNNSVFFPSILLDSYNGQSPDIVHLESLTGDPAKLDLIVNMDYSVFVAHGNGDGTFQSPKSVLTTFETKQLLFADLNGDGKLDMVTTGAGSFISYLGNGDGTFGSPTGTTAVNAGGVFDSVLRTVFSDFDSDGKLDFANGDAEGHISVANGNGDGTFHATPLLLSAKDPVLSPADINVTGVADLNGDGLPDLLAVSAQNDFGLIVGLTEPSGGFTYSTNVIKSSDFNGGFYAPTVADLNGDGKPDAAFLTSDGGFGVALSNGDGTFKTPIASINLSSQTLACPQGIEAAAGDLNGDKKIDLVFTYSGDKGCTGGTATPSGYFVVLGNGDGTFKPATFTAVGTHLTFPVLAAFHGAGNPPDLVVFDNENVIGSVLLLQGNGDGTFAAPTTIASHSVAQLIGSDFNQDGIPDLTIAAYDYNTPGTYLLAGKGDGTFIESGILGAGNFDDAAIYADVNGDGIPDFIGAVDGGLLAVFLGTGKGAFASPITYYSPFFGPLFAGKFLSDNSDSILVNHTFFMNQGGTSLTLTPSATSVTTGTAISVGSKLTATLSGLPAPTGTITYNDGSTKLGSEPVGTELTGINLATGTHTLTATYAGDAHFNPNTSSAVTVTVTAPPPPTPDFTFTSSASTLQITKGNSGTLTLNVADNSTLSGTVTFTCSGLPSEATCAFSPSSLTVASSASGSSTLTIATRAASSNARKSAARSSSLPIGLVATAGLFFLFIPRKRLPSMIMLLLIGVFSLGGLAAMSGCGGGSNTPTGPTDPGTPQGTSSVTVTATAVAGSTTVTHTSTVSLTVQ